MFPEEKLAEIRERLSIVELISEYVQLKKAGKNYKGLCPFHQEKSPSFIVSPDRDTFHCFGCGVGGNLFHFLMKLEALPFPEAVEKLAEKAGVEVKAFKADPRSAQERNQAFEIQRQAAWYYHCLLKKTPRDHPVWAYLTRRQLSEAMVQSFHLGFCPSGDSGLLPHLKKKGCSAEEIQACSLVRNGREFFRGRIIFPIFNHDKKVVGLGGRVYEEKDHGPKYLNSPESPVFRKGELFYGIQLAKNEIRKKNQSIICEGYLDVITLHAYGFTQAVAPLGTAFGPAHAKVLKRLAQEVVLIFDGDSAGQEAGRRALESLLKEGLIPSYVALQAGEDPDSFLRRYGRLVFEKKFQERRNLLEDLIDKASASIPQGPERLVRQAETARKLLALLEKIPDSIVQNLYRRRLAEDLEIPEEWLKGMVGPAPSRPETAKKRAPGWLPEEEMIFEVWLKCPTLRTETTHALEVEDFCSRQAKDLAQIFWEATATEPEGMTGKYFDMAPEGLLEVLSELTLRPNGLEEPETARTCLYEAVYRLKEKRLKQDLQALRKAESPEMLGVLQDKIQALSQVLRDKERIYGERKN